MPTPDASPDLADAYKFTQGDAEHTRLRALCLSDLYWFCDVVLGYGSRVPMREFAHRALCRITEGRTGHAAIDDAHVQRLELPREWGKTTVITQGLAIQLLCADPNTSILIANEKEQNAKDMLAAIKWQFESNEFLRALFPEIIPPDLNDTTWSASRIVVARTTGRKDPSVFVIGVGGTVTGMHPDVVIVDDMISREAMENARAGSWQIMHATNRWINQLRSLVSKQCARWRIYFIGTRWWVGDSYDHINLAYGYGEPPVKYTLRVPLPTGEMQVLTAERAGDLVTFRRAALENGRSSFPEKWSLEDLAKQRLVDEALFACLPARESVLCATGQKLIEEVRVGDLLLTKEGRQRAVTAVSARPYQGRLVCITPWGQGVPARVTPNHKIWTERGWVRADKLVVGDVLSTPLSQSTNPDAHDIDFWFLVGHFIGNGTIGKKGAIAHCFNKRDKALAEKIAAIIQRLWRRKARIEEQRTSLRITYRHPEAVAFFSQLSHGISQKWLPAHYETLPENALEALVAGYWAADGCTTDKGLTATSVSHRWLCQLQRILACLGHVAYVSRGHPNTTVIEGRVVRAQLLYQLWIYAASKRRTKVWLSAGRVYRKIRKLEREAFDGVVYNCEVAEDHSYVSATNTLTYANCNMMNNPADEHTATFKAGWLRTYDWLDERQFVYIDGAGAKRIVSIADLDVLLLVDPGGFAKRQVEDRARPAVVVVGDDRKGTYFVLDIYNEKDTFLAAIQQIVAWCTRYSPRKIYSERAGQQAAFAALLRVEIQKAGLNTVVDDTTLKPGTTQKEVRILALEPYFQRGQIAIGKGPAFLTFRDQYTQFPRTARFDVLDVLAYLPRVVKPRAQAGQSVSQKARQDEELAQYRARRGLS